MNSANKVFHFICITLFIITLSACKETDQTRNNIVESKPSKDELVVNEQRPITYSFENPKTGQEFEIIHAYILYEDFFEAVKDNPDQSTNQLYKQIITERVYDACFKDGQYYKYSVYEWSPEESDFNRIRKQIDTIDKEHLNKLFEESLVKSSKLLSSDEKITVCVFPKNEMLPSDMIFNGSGKIIISLYEHDYYNGNFDASMKAGIAHEYHHSVTDTHSTKGYFRNQLDSIVMEGQAVMFETFVYPEYNSTDYIFIDESYNKENWSRLETYLDSSPSNEFLMGGSNGLPAYYGYSEGYKIIRSYLELHPNMTVKEWTSKSPKEIFEESNYMANYE